MTSARSRLWLPFALAALLVAPAALAGCISKRPTIEVNVTAASKGLDDYASVDLVVRSVTVAQQQRDPITFPVKVEIDLVQLTAGRVSTLVQGPIDAAQYDIVAIEVASVRALTLDGQSPTVQVDKRLTSAGLPFKAEAGGTTKATLALTISKHPSSGELILRQVQSESKLG